MSSVLKRLPDSFSQVEGDVRPLSRPLRCLPSGVGVAGVVGVPGVAGRASRCWAAGAGRCQAAAAGALAACSTSATACRGSSGGMPNSVRMTLAVAVPLGNLQRHTSSNISRESLLTPE